MRALVRLGCLAALVFAAHSSILAASPSLEPTRVALDNGMTFLVVEQPDKPLVAAAWAVRGGSAEDPPGQPGLAHVVEHLLYAGSRTIGTRDWRREERLLGRWERAYEASVRAGSPSTRLLRLDAELRELERPGEYASVYTRAGALGLDAATRHDVTTFQVLVPAEKLELWFWLESDRLKEPVFRGFRRELAVVLQERRQRIDSTPAGIWFERFDAAWWGEGHPYAHSPGGDELTLRQLLPRHAREHFEAAYRPERLAAVLVGDVTVGRVRRLADRYFGRLSAERVRTSRSTDEDELALKAPAAALGSVEGVCACPSQVEIRYQTTPRAPLGDAVALDVLAGVLNSRSGRLYRELAVGGHRQEEIGEGAGPVAAAAVSEHVSRSLGGYLAVRLEAAAGATTSDLVAAWDGLLARLREGGVHRAELARTRRQLATNAWREIDQDAALAGRLAAAEALGGFEQIGAWFEAAAAVDSDALARVIDRYLVADRRAVLSLRRAAE